MHASIRFYSSVDNPKNTGSNAAGTGGTGTQGMPDPIGALQTLARQGTGNNQMMGMGGPGPNPQGMIPQASANTATNRKLLIKYEIPNAFFYKEYVCFDA